MPSGISHLAFVVVLAFLFSFAWSESPVAATLAVTDFGDSGSAGQLRTLMNAAGAGDTITIPAGTIILTGAAGEDLNRSGDLDILKDLTIQGAGAGKTIIDGGAVDGVFDILATHSVTISGVTIRNGRSTQAGGGGIRNFGTLHLANAVVSANAAIRPQHGDFNFGGGIRNLGTLTLTDVTITENKAEGKGGGVYNELGGVMTLIDVTVTGNTADVDGGGILNFGTATLTNVTVSGNHADVNGGGIFTGGAVVSAATATLTNVTVSGNSAGAFGGGIFNSATAILKNVILGGNTAVPGSTANCSGTITSLGHNLDSGATCGLTQLGDLTNTDPALGPPQDNGGFTFTQALLAGSPAIDAGTNTGCPPTDQRGVSRPQGAACDIGAYELASSPTLILSLSQPLFHSGTVLHMALRAQNPLPALTADFYFGILLPDGVTVCFITNPSPLAIQCLPRSADPKTFPPLATNIQAPQGLDVTLPDLMVFTFGGGEPQGTYSVFALATPPGAFADGSIDPADIIAVGFQSFTFSP